MIALQDLMDSIVSWRLAYWCHRNSSFVSDNRYAPTIRRFKTGQLFCVALVDTWIDLSKPGSLSMIQAEVIGSNFTGSTPNEALEDLLAFVKFQFMDDQEFNSIQ